MAEPLEDLEDSTLRLAAIPALRAVRRDLLERAAALQATAAAVLRANGRHTDAARADCFAARIRLHLAEPAATRHMRALTRTLYDSRDQEALLERALAGAMSLIGGDFGNLQLWDPSTGRLRIAAHSGFSSEFLEYFAVVEDESSACGRAVSQRSQTVIVDVRADDRFAPHRAIAAASRFRAVQSTPLLDPAGRLCGVISTHYRSPHRPSGRDLQLMQWYAEHVAVAFAGHQEASSTIYAATARLHSRTAELHESAAARLDQSAGVLRSGADQALERREWAWRARDRAQQQRERARALLARTQDPSPR